MRKKLIFLIIIILMISTFILQASIMESKKKAVALVNKGIEHIQNVGEEQAYKDFSNKEDGFVDGEYYIFVVDFNGVTLAHGGNPALVGKSLLELKDPNGVYFIKEFINVAKKKGEGWVNYKWSNPQTKKIGKKSSYVKTIKKTNYFLGCGIYLKK